jgi:hypothetical protein
VSLAEIDYTWYVTVGERAVAEVRDDEKDDE